jgi:hypothetical protein
MSKEHSFSINIVINSITFNNFTDRNIRVPYKPNPIKHYRQMASISQSKSSKNTHMIGHLNGIPGGSYNSVISTSLNETNIDQCSSPRIVNKILIPKTIYTVAMNDPDKCSNNCNDPEKIAKNRVRQSNTTINEGYFSRTIGYLQNRNKTNERKMNNFLDREESINLYGSYDKQKFFLRNSHTSGSLAPCAVSYYKTSNTQFALNNGTTSSNLTSRKKYNVDNLCRTRIPKNDYFFGITSSVDRKRYKKKICCFPPDPNEVTFEKIQNVVKDIMNDVSILRDIVNDNNAYVVLGDVVKVNDGEYQVPIIIKNINLSQLDEFESVNLLKFMREKFVNQNMNPDFAVQILGLDSIDYNQQFNRNGTRFYVDPRSLRVTYLNDVLNNPEAYIEKTGFVRELNNNVTVIEMEIDGLQEELTGNKLEAFKLYLENLYFLRYGVKYTSIEFV